MKKKSFTNSCRLVTCNAGTRKFHKKQRNKARRQVNHEAVEAFERTTDAWNIS